jgi:DNA-binding transcriptional ArsR family regulator
MSKHSNSKKADQATNDEGRFAYDGLDRAMHEKGRLAIMTSLISNPEGLLFGDLKRLTSLTDGNLSRHLEVLREAGLLEIWKGYEKKRPQTLCRITREGRKKFEQYLQELEQVIKDARQQEAELAKSGKMPKLPGNWIPT